MHPLCADRFRFSPGLTLLELWGELAACIVLLQVGEGVGIESTEERRVNHVVRTSHALAPTQGGALVLGFSFKTLRILTFSCDAFMFVFLRARHGAHVGVHLTGAGIARAARAHVFIGDR